MKTEYASNRDELYSFQDKRPNVKANIGCALRACVFSFHARHRSHLCVYVQKKTAHCFYLHSSLSSSVSGHSFFFFSLRAYSFFRRLPKQRQPSSFSRRENLWGISSARKWCEGIGMKKKCYRLWISRTSRSRFSTSPPRTVSASSLHLATSTKPTHPSFTHFRLPHPPFTSIQPLVPYFQALILHAYILKKNGLPETWAIMVNPFMIARMTDFPSNSI